MVNGSWLFLAGVVRATERLGEAELQEASMSH